MFYVTCVLSIVLAALKFDGCINWPWVYIALPLLVGAVVDTAMAAYAYWYYEIKKR